MGGDDGQRVIDIPSVHTAILANRQRVQDHDQHGSGFFHMDVSGLVIVDIDHHAETGLANDGWHGRILNPSVLVFNQ